VFSNSSLLRSKFFTDFSGDSKYKLFISEFCRGDEICRKGDFVDYFGILVHGEAFITHEYKSMKTLKLGSMIGFMAAADCTQRDQHPVTIVAKSDGIMAVLPFAEIKVESRKQPMEVSTSLRLIDS